MIYNERLGNLNPHSARLGTFDFLNFCIQTNFLAFGVKRSRHHPLFQSKARQTQASGIFPSRIIGK
jgi:hypothetical protein